MERSSHRFFKAFLKRKHHGGAPGDHSEAQRREARQQVCAPAINLQKRRQSVSAPADKWDRRQRDGGTGVAGSSAGPAAAACLSSPR